MSLQTIRDDLLKNSEYNAKSPEEQIAYANGILDMYNEANKEICAIQKQKP